MGLLFRLLPRASISYLFGSLPLASISYLFGSLPLAGRAGEGVILSARYIILASSPPCTAIAANHGKIGIKHQIHRSTSHLRARRKICGAQRNEIDALVYELYGLSDDEIALVEGATS